ncbi:MAG: GAF domain-containing protein [Bacteroidales bacterium]|nr:GAF domain-containing protein [Bacteroidales bacterium]
MKGYNLLIVTTLLSICTHLHAPIAQAQELYMNKGILNLSLSDDLRHRVISLTGEAEFYWQQLLEPAHFDTAQHLQPTYIPIPKSWHKCSIDDGQTLLPSNGYATYRFGLVLPRGLQPTTFTLKLTSVFSAYRLYLGSLLLAEVGQVGTSRETTTPKFSNEDISFILDGAPKPTADTLWCVLQAANFHHTRSGLHGPIRIGMQQNMLHANRLSEFKIAFAIGVCLLMLIIYVIQSSLYRTDASMVWLGITALAMSLRLAVIGDRLLTELIPNMPWELLFKLDNISGFCTIPLFALYFHSQYKRELPKRIFQIITIVGLLITAIVAVFPQRIYGQIKIIFELYVAIGGLYLTLGVMLRACINRRPYAIPTFMSLSVLFSTAFYDVMASMELAMVHNLASWGVLVFFLIQATSTTMRTVRIQKLADTMSARLQQQAAELEMKVEQRVAELSKQQAELLQHQAREQEENWRNVGTARINDVMVQHKDNYHELCHNTLTAIINYVNAKLGCIYLLQTTDDGQQRLEMMASYGLSKELQDRNHSIDTDEGLVGASFTKKQVQHVKDLPQGYIEISSGMGAATPQELLLQPLEFDEKVLGVVELATFEPFSDNAMLFVQQVSSIIAANLNNAMMNEQNVRLVKQFEAKEAEMRDEAAQLRANIEELEAIREEHERLKAELANSPTADDQQA